MLTQISALLGLATKLDLSESPKAQREGSNFASVFEQAEDRTGKGRAQREPVSEQEPAKSSDTTASGSGSASGDVEVQVDAPEELLEFNAPGHTLASDSEMEIELGESGNQQGASSPPADNERSSADALPTTSGWRNGNEELAASPVLTRIPAEIEPLDSPATPQRRLEAETFPPDRPLAAVRDVKQSMGQRAHGTDAVGQLPGDTINSEVQDRITPNAKSDSQPEITTESGSVPGAVRAKTDNGLAPRSETPKETIASSRSTPQSVVKEAIVSTPADFSAGSVPVANSSSQGTTAKARPGTGAMQTINAEALVPQNGRKLVKEPAEQAVREPGQVSGRQQPLKIGTEDENSTNRDQQRVPTSQPTSKAVASQIGQPEAKATPLKQNETPPVQKETPLVRKAARETTGWTLPQVTSPKAPDAQKVPTSTVKVESTSPASPVLAQPEYATPAKVPSGFRATTDLPAIVTTGPEGPDRTSMIRALSDRLLKINSASQPSSSVSAVQELPIRSAPVEIPVAPAHRAADSPIQSLVTNHRISDPNSTDVPVAAVRPDAAPTANTSEEAKAVTVVRLGTGQEFALSDPKRGAMPVKSPPLVTPSDAINGVIDAGGILPELKQASSIAAKQVGTFPREPEAGPSTSPSLDAPPDQQMASDKQLSSAAKSEARGVSIGTTTQGQVESVENPRPTTTTVEKPPLGQPVAELVVKEGKLRMVSKGDHTQMVATTREELPPPDTTQVRVSSPAVTSPSLSAISAPPSRPSVEPSQYLPDDFRGAMPSIRPVSTVIDPVTPIDQTNMAPVPPKAENKTFVPEITASDRSWERAAMALSPVRPEPAMTEGIDPQAAATISAGAIGRPEAEIGQRNPRKPSTGATNLEPLAEAEAEAFGTSKPSTQRTPRPGSVQSPNAPEPAATSALVEAQVPSRERGLQIRSKRTDSNAARLTLADDATERPAPSAEQSQGKIHTPINLANPVGQDVAARSEVPHAQTEEMLDEPAFATTLEAARSGPTAVAAPMHAGVRGSATAILQQIADQAQRLQDGQIEVRLDPEELGRVRLHMTGTETAMTVHIQADRPETLDLLRRNVNQLAKELADAGYETGNFTFGDSWGGSKNGKPEDRGSNAPAPTMPAADAAPTVANSLTPSMDGLDIMV